MKTTYKNDFSQFKKTAKKISLLIRNGQWEKLSSSVKESLQTTLVYYFNKIKQFFSRRKLVRVLGLASVLVSSNVVAQSFAPADTNAFGMQNTGNYLHKPDFADIDNDGDLDLFTNGYYGTILFQENTGTVNQPVFADTVENPFGLSGILTGYTYSSHTADIDGDGDFDLFFTGDYGNVTFFENTGTVTTPSFGPEQVGPFGLTDSLNILSDFIDLDNDGDLDVIAFHIDYGTASNFIFIENIGTATAPAFTTPVSAPFGLSPASGINWVSYGDFADLDFDGDLDMIRTEYYGDSVYFHENMGTASVPVFDAGDGVSSPFDLPAMTTLTSYSYVIAPSFADIDGDGDQDLFITEYDGNTFFYENVQYNLGIDKVESGLDIEVFPNPTSHFINIKSDIEVTEVSQLNILSIDGKKVFTSKNLIHQIDVSKYTSGIYFVEIISKEGLVSKSKFIKE